MRPDQNVVHRKTLTPWYDSDTLCILTVAFALAVFLFSIVGISVSGESPVYRDFIWLPTALLLTSGSLVFSITVRLAKRLIGRYQNRYLRNFSGNSF